MVDTRGRDLSLTAVFGTDSTAALELTRPQTGIGPLVPGPDGYHPSDIVNIATSSFSNARWYCGDESIVDIISGG